MRSTKDVGLIGEKYFELLMVEKGIPCFKPLQDAPYDYLIFYKGRYLKVEVKTSTRDNNGAVIFNTTKSVAKTKTQEYDSEDNDFFFLYSTVYKQYAFIESKKVTAQKSLRATPSTNGVRYDMFKDFQMTL